MCQNIGFTISIYEMKISSKFFSNGRCGSKFQIENARSFEEAREQYQYIIALSMYNKFSRKQFDFNMITGFDLMLKLFIILHHSICIVQVPAICRFERCYICCSLWLKVFDYFLNYLPHDCLHLNSNCLLSAKCFFSV